MDANRRSGFARGDGRNMLFGLKAHYWKIERLWQAIAGPARVFARADQWMDYSYGTPLSAGRNAKLLVLGMPKSGNTWMQGLLADCFDLDAIEPLREKARKGAGMSHLPYGPRIAYRQDFVHAVYMLRDVRDIVVSMYHYAQTPFFREHRPEVHYPDIESFYYDYFLGRIIGPYRFFDHAEGYAQRGVPIVRYERLCDDTAGELTRLIACWGLEVGEGSIAAAIDANRIDKLRETGKQLHRMVPATHFRQGGYGHYRTELPPAVLADCNRRFGAVLRRWGYAIEPLDASAPTVHEAIKAGGERP